jgi:hypothetical protein
MKKRLLAMTLVFAMLVTLMPIVGASDLSDTVQKAVDDSDYLILVDGASDTFGSTEKTGDLTFTVNLKGTNLGYEGATIAVCLKIDSTKLSLISLGNGNVLTATATSKKLSSTQATFAKAEDFGNHYTPVDEDDETTDISGVLTNETTYLKKGNFIYLMVNMKCGANVQNYDWTNLTPTLQLGLRLNEVDGKQLTLADLDSTSIQVATADEAYYFTESIAAKIPACVGETTTTYVYNNDVSKADASYVKMDAPIITLDGKDVEDLPDNLNGVTAKIVSKDKETQEVKAINVPALYNEDGSISTETTSVVQVAAKAYKDADLKDAFNETEAAEVKWTYEVGVKTEGLAETAAAALEASVKQTVSIDEDGVITVAAGAPACTLQITATGQWDSDSAGNKARTVTSEAAELQLCHGDAKSEDGGNDPTNPGLDDEEAALRGVKIVDGDKNVLASSAAKDTNYDIYAAQGSEETITLTGTGFDQYGDDFAIPDADSKWTTSDNNAPERNADTGAISVKDADTGAYVYTFASGTYSASVTINVSDYAATWSDLKSAALTYGEKLALKDATAESVTKSGEALGDDVKVEFVWKDDVDTPNAGTTKVTRLCKVDGNVVATKDYPITVAKADQNITIAGDTASEKISDFALDLGKATKLETTVTNAWIDEQIAKATDDATATAVATGAKVTYDVDPANVGISVDSDNDTITGTTNQAKAELTITAEGGPNYNEATRVVKVSVVRLIHANITFDPDPDPETETGVVYGKTITATISDGDGQKGSLVGCTYNWGYYDVDAETGKAKFVPLADAAALEATADSDGVYTATATYETSDEDIDHTLAIQVITPSEKSDTYDYYDSSTTAMKQPIARKANDKTLTLDDIEVVKTTKNSVIVKYIEGAEYAIEPKAADGETQTTPTDTDFERNEYKDDVTNSFVTLNGDEVVEDAQVVAPETDSEEGKTDESGEEAGQEENSTVPDENSNTEENSGTEVNTQDADDVTEPNDDDSGDTAKAETTPTGYRFLTLSDGTKLNPDTEYVVYARIAATDTVAASNIVSTETKTRKIGYLDPSDEGGPDPALKEAKVELTGDAKVGATLTATITDENDPKLFTVAGVDEATETTVDVKWYRVADDGTETEIADATGLTYTITNDDMGYNIKVEISLNDEQDWDGVISATTENAVPSGYKISGAVKSFNTANEITYVLYAWDANAGTSDNYSTTPVNGHGSIVDNAVVGVHLNVTETESTIGQQTQSFTIENVPDGMYKLVLMKTAHLNAIVLNIVVNGGDVDLTGEQYPEGAQTITMAPGDVNGDGDINSNDSDMVVSPAYYRKTTLDVQPEFAKLDINGDGDINSNDVDIIVTPAYYRKNASDFTVTIPISTEQNS